MKKKWPEDMRKWECSIKHLGAKDNPHTIWKSVDASFLRKRSAESGTKDAISALQSTWDHSFAQWTTVLHSVSGLETNMPWAELRSWFRAADVIFPIGYIVKTDWPTWEEFDE